MSHPRIIVAVAGALCVAGCLEPTPATPQPACGPGTVNVGGVCVVDEQQPPSTPDAGRTVVADVQQQETVDPPPDPEQICIPAIRSSKPIGAGCEKHCECDTGYCYDEAYLGDFRFCTRDCGSQGCNVGVTGGIEQYKCLIMGSFEAKHDLKHKAICQKICLSVDECKGLSSAYDQCGDPDGKGTLWDGITLNLHSTCQIAAEVQ